MRQPIERTLIHLRELGADAIVVEKWNHWGKCRQDLWGADILVRQGRKGIAIQATTGDHHAEHVTNALKNPLVVNWLIIGIAFEIWSWQLMGKPGKRKLWTSRVTQLCLTTEGEVRPL